LAPEASHTVSGPPTAFGEAFGAYSFAVLAAFP